MEIAKNILISVLIMVTVLGCSKERDVTVGSTSMEPTFGRGEIIAFSPLADTRMLSAGTIVIIKSPLNLKDLWIRRVVAIGPCTVSGNNRVFFVDNKKYDVHSIGLNGSFSAPFGPTLVPEQCAFVMGDNLGNSRDGREFGYTRISDIVGIVNRDFAIPK